MICTLLSCSLGYNLFHKVLCLVLYSHNLYLDQCKLHLEDIKGTYPSQRSQFGSLRLTDWKICLNHAVNPALLSKTWSASLERDKLCKVFVTWNLHKKANALVVRSGPNTWNIGYLTWQVAHFYTFRSGGGCTQIGRNVCTAQKGVLVCWVQNALWTVEDRKSWRKMGEGGGGGLEKMHMSWRKMQKFWRK